MLKIKVKMRLSHKEIILIVLKILVDFSFKSISLMIILAD